MCEKMIRTSEKDWLGNALECYTNKESFEFIDDANLGIVKKDVESAVALLKAAKEKGDIPWKEIAGVLAGMGIAGVGIWLVAAAIADPEPTSKLGLLIAGGIALILTGSFGILVSLGVKFKVEVSKEGVFKVEPK